jgi:hypothetical protein
MTTRTGFLDEPANAMGSLRGYCAVSPARHNITAQLNSNPASSAGVCPVSSARSRIVSAISLVVSTWIATRMGADSLGWLGSLPG